MCTASGQRAEDGFLRHLQELLCDSNPDAVAAACCALSEIRESTAAEREAPDRSNRSAASAAAPALTVASAEFIPSGGDQRGWSECGLLAPALCNAHAHGSRHCHSIGHAEHGHSTNGQIIEGLPDGCSFRPAADSWASGGTALANLTQPEHRSTTGGAAQCARAALPWVHASHETAATQQPGSPCCCCARRPRCCSAPSTAAVSPLRGGSPTASRAARRAPCAARQRGPLVPPGAKHEIRGAEHAHFARQVRLALLQGEICGGGPSPAESRPDWRQRCRPQLRDYATAHAERQGARRLCARLAQAAGKQCTRQRCTAAGRWAALVLAAALTVALLCTAAALHTRVHDVRASYEGLRDAVHNASARVLRDPTYAGDFAAVAGRRGARGAAGRRRGRVWWRAALDVYRDLVGHSVQWGTALDNNPAAWFYATLWDAAPPTDGERVAMRVRQGETGPRIYRGAAAESAAGHLTPRGRRRG
eukprot:TRINITY_DN12622_c0_g1_i11.p1 TRINITY_DN12622_c0_g1~~TRINITY_DN12622_c0_g1_i11.p1  ORF type:complete len:478 (+),score=104.80 TRINITY_DN12622_c0_g1_i11:321-1754(+)